jgi:hypothetical protein
MGLANLGSELETCVGSRVHLVGVSISFEKNFYRLPFTPPSLVRRIGPSQVTVHNAFNSVFGLFALKIGMSANYEKCVPGYNEQLSY